MRKRKTSTNPRCVEMIEKYSIFLAMSEIFSVCCGVKYFPCVSLIVSRDTDITAAYQVTSSPPIRGQREEELTNERTERPCNCLAPGDTLVMHLRHPAFITPG